jgi:hypothetical protein
MKNVHVDYEYAMMTWMDKLYRGDRLDDPAVYTNMVNITGYMNQSNLIIYLIENHDVKLPKDIANIMIMINDQIRTISSNRTDKDKHKLQPKHFKKLRKFIDKYKVELGIE